MKIRTSYVTNSSSSSFVVLNVKNPILSKIFKKAKEKLEDNFEFFMTETNDDEWEINVEDGWIEMPSSKEDIIQSIISLFFYDYYFDEDDEESIKNFLKETKDNEIVSEIFKNRKEILDEMESIEILQSNVGWQGDDESRFDQDNYDKETLKSMYEDIAEENGIDVSEVDEDMFCDYVCDKVSNDETRFSYDKKTDKVKITRDFYVE